MDAQLETVLERGARPAGGLRDFWHPVATSAEVTEEPLRARLLDAPLAIWRSGDQLAAFHDLCIHRGTPLSMGWRDGDRLVCAYHGWQYTADGACVRIPSLPPDRGIPSKARATTYRVMERDGLIWVCLGDPASDPPDFPPQFTDPAYTWYKLQPESMRANAARFIENNMDQSHFAFVHRGVLAVDPEVSPIEIEPTVDGFTWDIDNPLNTLKPDGPRERSRFRVVLPFALFIDKYTPDGDAHNVIAFIGSPVSAKESRVFRFIGRNFRRFSDEEEAQHQQRVFEQDRAVVEAQRPEELPLDLREELHLRGPDSAALAYRKALAALGVDWG
jgi:phenylpropionate dioxygenase-like ring-hydroxylating dioxygenase large terminal subunit